MSDRSFYSNKIESFLNEEDFSILGKMTDSNPFDLTEMQKYAWSEEITILKDQLKNNGYSYIIRQEDQILIKLQICGQEITAEMLQQNLF